MITKKDVKFVLMTFIVTVISGIAAIISIAIICGIRILIVSTDLPQGLNAESLIISLIGLLVFFSVQGTLIKYVGKKYGTKIP